MKMEHFESEEESQDVHRAASASASRKHLEAMAAIEAKIKEKEQEEYRKIVLEKAKKTIQKLLDQGIISKYAQLSRVFLYMNGCKLIFPLFLTLLLTITI